MIRYVLHPGYVISATDGDEHFIGAAQLMSLYRVPKSECIIDDTSARLGGLGYSSDLIHLYPRFDGNYALPEGEAPPR